MGTWAGASFFREKNRRETAGRKGVYMQVPEHIAIILDGNGRWAKSKGMPRSYGHVKGCENLERICNTARDLGVKYLTVYAFSTENWKRSPEEVNGLMNLFRRYLHDTPVHYLIKYRLQEAANLLLTTEKKIIVISQNVGFENIDYFCKTFKKYYQMTPTEYRKTKKHI